MRAFLLVFVASFFTLPAMASDLAEVTKSEVDHFLRLDGVVEAVHRSTLSAQTSGQVVELLVDAGDLVPAGALVIRLKDVEQKAEVRRAEAAVEAAKAQFREAQREYERVKGIYARKLVAQSVMDRARSGRDRAKADLEAAEAWLARAKEQLAYTRIRAPYSGIVLERHVHVGESVAPGVPLITGVSLDQLRVVADVPQNDIEAVRKEKLARIWLPSAGVVMRDKDAITFFAYADPRTTTFKVRVELPEGLSGLYPGMYLKTDFKVGTRTVLSIPQSAVVHRAAMTGVYVAGADKPILRQVRLGPELDQNRVEVLAGLSEGEKIYREPAEAIALRQEVKSHD